MSKIIVKKSNVEELDEILNLDFLRLIETIHKQFYSERSELLEQRTKKQLGLVNGNKLSFLRETIDIRNSNWEVSPIPQDLLRRWTEITGPATPKMAINAMNSGADIWLADLEDSSTPHWKNVLQSHRVIKQVIRNELSFQSEDGKSYKVVEGKRPTLKVRPRGLHLDEKNCLVDSVPTIAAFFDAALHVFNNAKFLLENKSGPYLYIPKLESYLEARLWNDVLSLIENELELPKFSIKVTVLIETIPAAFQMDEILYELQKRIVGLNAGRWDYLFSIIKYFRNSGMEYILPDRNQITMNAPMMRTYTSLLVNTCHKRQAMAIGGMSAFIPSRTNADINTEAFIKVRSDKEREANIGFDGSWVAHPDLVPICRDEFFRVLGDQDNQVDKTSNALTAIEEGLLSIKETPGACTESGLRTNIEIFLRYVYGWLNGNGAVSINNLMEDAATAEISRSQIWQQINYSVIYSDTGSKATVDLSIEILEQEKITLLEQGYEIGLLESASEILRSVCLTHEFPEFLTSIASNFIKE
jgi:malate synthase